MKLTVNGENRAFDQGDLSVGQLLKLCEVEMPETVSVQINGAFVDRTQYESRQLAEDDDVDFLYFMGGGR